MTQRAPGRVTAEQLRSIAYQKLSGDPLCVGSHAHGGAPDRRGEDGLAKRDVYAAAMSDDLQVFEKMATYINGNRRDRRWMISSRTWLKAPGRKPRPIDIPTETKRLESEFLRDSIQALVHKRDVLLPTVVGFRDIDEFPAFTGREDGITIQDIFASTVWQLLTAGGPYAVVIDLRDAFGNLPHAAINSALVEIGFSHQMRRRIVESVRIRTRVAPGRVLKPKGYGIEQGCPLSPLIFNLVISYVLRRVAEAGNQGASYGDDLVLVAATEKKAHEAFEHFLSSTSALGFKNVRPLGAEGKATRIYDTRVTPAPLLKTYMVDRKQIGLTRDKETILRAALPEHASLKSARTTNGWKVVSKSYLRTVVPIRGKVTSNTGGPSPEGGKPEGYVARGSATTYDALDHLLPIGAEGGASPLGGSAQERTDLEWDAHRRGPREQEGVSPIRDAQPQALTEADERYSVTPSGSVSTTIPGPAVPVDNGKSAKGMLRGRVSASRGGLGVEVPLDPKGEEEPGHRLPSPFTVLTLRDEDVNVLKEGRRLRAGDNYRGGVVDVRDLLTVVGQARLNHAVQQIARVASLHGSARLLVHPGDPWVWSAGVFERFGPVRQEPHPEGIVLLFRRALVRDDCKRIDVPRGEPDADAHIVRAKRDRLDCRAWNVIVDVRGRRRLVRTRVSTPNRDIGYLEAVAHALGSESSARVAVAANKALRRFLLSSGPGIVRARHVGLADAVASLRRRHWTAAGGWLLGYSRSGSG